MERGQSEQARKILSKIRNNQDIEDEIELMQKRIQQDAAENPLALFTVSIFFWENWTSQVLSKDLNRVFDKDNSCSDWSKQKFTSQTDGFPRITSLIGWDSDLVPKVVISVS